MTATHAIIAMTKIARYRGPIGLLIGWCKCIVIRHGAWWLIGRFDAFRLKSRGFESRSTSRLVYGTLGKSFTRSCLWRFGVKLRHSIRSVSAVPLSSSGLEEAL